MVYFGSTFQRSWGFQIWSLGAGRASRIESLCLRGVDVARLRARAALLSYLTIDQDVTQGTMVRALQGDSSVGALWILPALVPGLVLSFIFHLYYTLIYLLFCS